MINRKASITLLTILMLAAGVSGGGITAAQKMAGPAPVVIPFEPVTRHILIVARINNSGPLWFILDTGDKDVIVDIGKAKSLGLNLHGEVRVGGAGPGTLSGARVRDASLTVEGLPGNVQPVVMAIPLDGLKSRFGHDIDGIIGADFIKQYVVEIDYPARVLRFHDKDKFNYSGSGEIVPLSYIHGGYPIIDAEVTVAAGRPPIKAKFVIDIGSGGSLALHRPFVEQQSLPDPSQKTIRLVGAGGAGGKVTGRTGRIAALQIGKIKIENPLTLFSEDKAGAFASSQIQGNIGAQILSKFRVLFDYARDRMILEPNASLKDLIGPAASGVRLIAEGSDYRTFRVDELLEDSPGTEAGIQKGDVIVEVDGRAAAEWTLTTLHELFEKPIARKLVVRRGEQTVRITLTPRRLV